MTRRKKLQRGVHPPEWSQDERDRLDRAYGRKGRMHKRGPANGWSPRTNVTVWSPYALALGWQRDRGILDWSLTPAARWPEPVLEAYDAHLVATYAKGTRRNRLSGLERAIAVLEPEADRRLFLSAVYRVGKILPGVDRELRAVSSLDLEDIADELMDGADAGELPTPMHAARQYRVGLQIAFLADLIPRNGEFVPLELGVHVIREGDRWYLKAARANNSSTRSPRKRPIPARLTRRVDCYVHVHRDVLCRGRGGKPAYSGKAMWVSSRRKPQSETSVRECITDAAGVNPHAFRSSMVTTVAIHAPEQMHAVQVVAGHAPGSPVTTENYNAACSYSVSLDWNATAAAIRARGIERMRLNRRR